MKTILITGAGGLVGSESAAYFLESGHNVIGIDNDSREKFFGVSIQPNIQHLRDYSKYIHYNLDIRDLSVEDIFKGEKIDVIIHAAAQPSHDLASSMIFDDFDINAKATIQLLEFTKRHCPQAVFIYTSTNKVYGDYPNKLNYKKSGYRYTPVDHAPFNESTPIDGQLHSFFGCSKLAADLYCQEYGKNLGLNTCIFRLGCITGSRHKGAKLHGFLNYLVKSIAREQTYEIIGYDGLQVRDNIHARDLVLAFENVINKPVKGEVFNLGGASFSNCSILEAIHLSESILDKKSHIIVNPSERTGDHIWYISDISKFQNRYPNWKLNYNTTQIIKEIAKNL